ncbi:hypothetical protein L9F63_022565 [Diploptera punctata]|uniref:Uncharacterized protein n=1 Tax=Diploptera punctata TaxID=6984 RepID=A0AAD7ZN47_DIPPU|nr:hypothetical protein L9F63_022565 [Diploptera punctata]
MVRFKETNNGEDSGSKKHVAIQPASLDDVHKIHSVGFIDDEQSTEKLDKKPHIKLEIVEETETEESKEENERKHDRKGSAKHALFQIGTKTDQDEKSERTEPDESVDVASGRQKRTVLLPPPTIQLRGKKEDEDERQTDESHEQEEREDEDERADRKDRLKIVLPTEISIPLPDTHRARGIFIPPNLKLMRTSSEEISDEEEEEERSSSSSSEEMPPPKTMADVVLLVQSLEARKKRHKEISDIILGVPFDMSELEKIGIISVLEDCVDQLSIIGKTNNKPIVIPDLKFTTLKYRY